MVRLLFFASTLLVCFFLIGCGGAPTAPVKGKVMLDGKPVTAGNLTFQLVPEGNSLEAGKPATAEVKSDGTFQLTTNRLNDGALIGRHRVKYSPPNFDDEADAAQKKLAQQYANCAVPKDFTVEIKSGDNDITIELKRGN
jgi:hypothetical protein